MRGAEFCREMGIAQMLLFIIIRALALGAVKFVNMGWYFSSGLNRALLCDGMLQPLIRYNRM